MDTYTIADACVLSVFGASLVAMAMLSGLCLATKGIRFVGIVLLLASAYGIIATFLSLLSH